jgi:hypothetical protein
MQEDPIGFEAGDGDLFRYVTNDPTNVTDISGLESQPRNNLIPPPGTPPAIYKDYVQGFKDGNAGGGSLDILQLLFPGGRMGDAADAYIIGYQDGQAALPGSNPPPPPPTGPQKPIDTDPAITNARFSGFTGLTYGDKQQDAEEALKVVHDRVKDIVFDLANLDTNWTDRSRAIEIRQRVDACFGPGVTHTDVRTLLAAFRKLDSGLSKLQITFTVIAGASYSGSTNEPGHEIKLGSGYTARAKRNIRERASTIFHELTHYYLATTDQPQNPTRLVYANDLDDLSKGYTEEEAAPPFRATGPAPALTTAQRLQHASTYEGFFRLYLPN